MKRIFFVLLTVFLVGCGRQAVGLSENTQENSQNQSSASAELVLPERDFAAEAFGWRASIPEDWQGYEQTGSGGNEDYILVANYDPDEFGNRKPDDYHEIKIERLEASEEESITAITDELLEGKNIDARKLLFTKDYQGNRIEFSDASGGKGLMTIFRQEDRMWVLTYEELEELDGQTTWVYQRILETFQITE